MKKIILGIMVFMIMIVSSITAYASTPSNDYVYITPNASVVVTDNLTGECLASDTSGHDIVYTYQWYLNDEKVDYVNDWEDLGHLESGLPTGYYTSHPEMFIDDDGELNLVIGDTLGKYYGYQWDGSTWSSDTGAKSGFPSDIGSKAKTQTYRRDGELYAMLADSSDDNVEGYKRNGATWSSNAGSIAGLPSTFGAVNPSLAIFEYNSNLYLIITESDGEFQNGYIWNETNTSWTQNDYIFSNLDTEDVGTTNNPEVELIGNTPYMIAGRSTGLSGYYFNGSSWISDSSIVDFSVTDHAEYSADMIYYNESLIVLVYGNAPTGTDPDEFTYTMNVRLLDADNTENSDYAIFSCEATDVQDQLTTGFVNSSNVLIGDPPNANPELENIYISPNSTVYSNDTLKGYCQYSDGDADNLNYSYIWYKDDVLNISGTLNNQIENILLNLENITTHAKGEEWIFSCKADDTISTNLYINTSVVEILNFIPTTPTATTSRTNETHITTSGSGSIDIDDGDTVSYYYEYLCNNISGSVIQSLSTNGIYTINYTNCSGENNIYVKTYSYDGENYSSSYYETSINQEVFPNTPPTTPDSSIISRNETYINVTGLGSTDIDYNDTIIYEYSFYCSADDGVIMQGLSNNSNYLINLSECSVENNIYARIYAFDGENYSSSYESLNIEQNFAPTTPSGSSVISSDGIVQATGVGSSDADTWDNITYFYEFRCNTLSGTILQDYSINPNWTITSLCNNTNVYVNILASDTKQNSSTETESINLDTDASFDYELTLGQCPNTTTGYFGLMLLEIMLVLVCIVGIVLKNPMLTAIMSFVLIFSTLITWACGSIMGITSILLGLIFLISAASMKTNY